MTCITNIDNLKEVTDSGDTEVGDDDAGCETGRKREEVTEERTKCFEEHGGHVDGEPLLGDDGGLWRTSEHGLRIPVQRF